ncbi:hypothetical protein F4823DRAFT_149202 [Ustulina deusta]|nr:hypothetical protein F4823DRAFT_149202 [Ustulina deusta]
MHRRFWETLVLNFYATTRRSVNFLSSRGQPLALFVLISHVSYCSFHKSVQSIDDFAYIWRSLRFLREPRRGRLSPASIVSQNPRGEVPLVSHEGEAPRKEDRYDSLHSPGTIFASGSRPRIPFPPKHIAYPPHIPNYAPNTSRTCWPTAGTSFSWPEKSKSRRSISRRLAKNLSEW